mmetsp:Transcript_95475/g.275064  ORF Transcript_95475/g.275064 Transcript_95475/m.275064 type:complete len:306 (+) Transcript_95475:185-1102(+)
MLSGFLQCCNSHNEAGAVAELRVVHLSSDVTDFPHQPPGPPDAVDWTSGAILGPGGRSDSLDVSYGSTPRQRSFQERIRLPRLRRYPVPPGCSSDDPEEVRREELQRTYREFVIDLHRGIHMTQLTSTQDYSNIHCQILEDLQTLKVDQGSGEIIEFPLGAVSKVYRIVKNDEKFNGAFAGSSALLSRAEHIVVVEFMRRKLAFVFNEIQVAQRFLMCIELLIRRAQEFQAEGAPPSRTNAGGSAGGGGIAPIFASFGGAGSKAREGGERMGKPLLPLDVVRPAGGGGGTVGRPGGGSGGLSPCG